MIENKPTHVYYVLDPRCTLIPKEGEHVYVGITQRGVKRLKGHLKDSCYGEDYKCNWISALIDQGIVPIISLRCLVPTASEAGRIERALIKKLRARGVKVTNATEGGAGLLGFRHSEETKRQFSEDRKDNTYALGKRWTNSEETREKKREAQLGRHHTEETKQKLSEIKKGIHHTQETKLKMSESKKGNTNNLGTIHSQEYCDKISKQMAGNQNLLGHVHSEETKAKIGKASEVLHKLQIGEPLLPEELPIVEKMKRRTEKKLKKLQYKLSKENELKDKQNEN